MEVVQEERVFLCLTDAFNPLRAGLELQDYDHVVSEEDDVDGKITWFLTRPRLEAAAELG